jgi:hypothetical protein
MPLIRVCLIVAIPAIVVYLALSLLQPGTATPATGAAPAISPAEAGPATTDHTAAIAAADAASTARPHPASGAGANSAARTAPKTRQPAAPPASRRITATPKPATPAPAPPAPRMAPATAAADTGRGAAWWMDANAGRGHLHLVQATDAGFEPGIALLFSAPMSAPAANLHIRVLDGKGRAVPGRWQVSADNPRMMLFPARQGTYTLALAAELADAQGHSIGAELRGRVTVH